MSEVNLLKDIVFFSSTFRDFKEAREQILLSFQGLDIHVETMEHFDASATPLRDECLRRVANSQVYLLVIGEMYGTIDEESGKSYTELEYECAYDLKNRGLLKDIWVFKSTDKYAPKPEHKDVDQEKIEKLKKFKKTVCTRHSPKHYNNLDDLRALIMRQ